MEAENFTPYPAILLTTIVEEELMSASMIARITYDLAGTELVPAAEHSWLVSVEPWQSPLGEFAPDQPFRKAGVDVLVAGCARAPNGQPAAEVALAVEVGDFRASAVAIGPRVWRKGRGGELVPSDPEPFVSLPIGLESAYGGGGEYDGQPFAYPLNPAGLGFYFDEAAALDHPLPRLEDDGCRIRTFSDRPDPVGFGLCQYPHPLRARESVTIDGRPAMDIASRPPGASLRDVDLQFTSRMFNRAFPRLVAPPVPAGAEVTLRGFSAEGPLSFRIPEDPLCVQLDLGARRIVRTPSLDEIGVDVDKRQVCLGYRYPFRYGVVQYEERRCTLLLAEARSRALASHGV